MPVEPHVVSKTLRHVSLSPSCKELSSLLSLCGRESRPLLGSSIHAAILKTPHLFTFNNRTSHRDVLVVWNSLISMYSKCGRLLDAAKVFDGMTLKDTISWNSIISGCFTRDEFKMGLEYFNRMRRSDFYELDPATFTTVLSVCIDRELVYMNRMLHALIVLRGFEQQVPVGNALISAYFRCCCSASAQKVFHGLHERNVITWTAMVSGLAQGQLFDESLVLFQEMRQKVEANSLTYSSSLQACSGLRAIREGMQIHGLVLKSGFESDLCVESALMDMYSKCGMIEEAYQIFQSCEDRDEIFFTVILVGFAQNGLEERAVEFFMEIVNLGIEVDANIISAVLGAFGSSAPFSLGKQIHALVVKKCFNLNTFVSNGLINMYSKCGELGESLKIFNLMVHKNSVSWNSLIAAFARHGHGSEALQLYEDMRSEGMEPTDITFLSLLHACSHVGSVEKGMEFLDSMSSIHGIVPRMEHYACIVDMLGRAGQLKEARLCIEKSPMGSNALLWQAFLGACSIHGDLEMGKYAAEHLILVAPECHAAYVLLANIYSSEGRWAERARIIKKMKEMGVKKDTGMSWIEIEKEIHCFVVEDKVHPQAKIIYDVLSELIALSRDKELLPDKKFMLCNLEI